jgi:hypothetical protein
MFTDSDLKQLQAKGISVEKAEKQIEFFKNGFPYLTIQAPASVRKGIFYITENDQDNYIEIWDNYLRKNKKILKFTPASGAASRMFKDLFAFLDKPSAQPDASFLQTFFDGIKNFAFYDLLQSACHRNEEKSIEELIADGEQEKIVENLLLEKGLNYGNYPKGVVLFHQYPEGSRAAVEEHLVEGSMYARNKAKNVYVHFTVSPEHRDLFQKLIDKKTSYYSRYFDVQYFVDFSEQKPSTDTIAVTIDNQLFRDDNGKILFRPGGHGALIENLNDIDADVVFIKNIDNVVPDRLKSFTAHYKRALAGMLVDYQQKIFEYLSLIDSGKYTHEQLLDMLYFLQNKLYIKNPETKYLEDAEWVLYIKSKLNRPLRICGMVKNVGEPGGGPFLTVNSDGTISPQILESSQIDMENPEVKQIFEQSTHFNPVDLICALKNYKGEKFDLGQYVDKNTGFISEKSKDGKILKALELPGLWNGAMSDWNTVLVEVPIQTFNPVKTVNDLLREEHR